MHLLAQSVPKSRVIKDYTYQEYTDLATVTRDMDEYVP